MGRHFQFNYVSHAGERYHIHFGTDTTSTNFCYSLEVYFDDPSQIQNLELDMNQVTTDRFTYVMGTQSSSVSGTWDYTYVSNGATHQTSY